jgi:hypothetical protein
LNLAGEPTKAFAVTAHGLLDWALGRYGIALREDAPAKGTEGPVAGVQIAWHTMVHPSKPAAVWAMTWNHPDSDDGTLRWGVQARIGYDAAQAWLSLRVGVEPVGMSLRPVRITVRPPAVIRGILGDPGASADGRRLTTTCEHLTVANVPALVALLSRIDRSLPVVVLTPREGGRPSVDPDAVADRLASLAHVFMLDSPAATFALTDSVGKERSVFLGAVRLYWPGFSPTANAREHPLWLPNVIDEWEERGRDFVDTLFARVQREAAFRLAVPPLEREIQTALDRQRADELMNLRARLAEGTVPDDFLEDFEATLTRAETAELVIESLRHEVDLLKEQRDAANENVAALSIELGRMAGDVPGGAETDEAPAALEPRTMVEAVESARSQAQHLIFLEAAIEGARASDYRQPQRILDSLLILDEIAGRYGADDLAQGFQAAFQAAGLNYTADISATDRGKFGGDYECEYQGERVILGPHLKFGQGSSDTCARIYWYVDEPGRALVVGHVGKHLRTSDS